MRMQDMRSAVFSLLYSGSMGCAERSPPSVYEAPSITAVLYCCALPASAGERPNIIYMMADDGYTACEARAGGRLILRTLIKTIQHDKKNI